MKQHEIQGATRKQQSKLVLIGQLFQARDCAYIRRAVEKQLVYTASFPSGSTRFGGDRIFRHFLGKWRNLRFRWRLGEKATNGERSSHHAGGGL
jgi:hypothetical protein